ncbi:MBL fold metallo-hydrolase [Glutamicibacter protophormiae]|uniref:Ribonuclease BN n=1 Tax=Kocuria varians TaxID=1272 RepID=A0A7D7PT08_KOCVA|nr:MULTISPECIES: MBL fold metallo-hydrolase [Kocuria]QMS57434.1 Ribonuclease BN [Kocuria varians]RUP84251.1 MBL fold metallo-hydrolase [Kocuria sp. HSID17590]RUQ11607.1 MBL fold metallo-hydrolase [Kocuria sp. HSID17582]WNB89442.1 MBL fold metallo-hydrolase [Glutamicibacter protophormiae]
MLLTVVGNTGSFPGPDAPASCYLLSGEDADGRTWRIVLDMGNGTLGALQRHIELETIDAIMLSHLHPDHCVDVGGLHVAIKWDPRGWTAGPIPLFGPSQLPTYLNQLHLLPPEHSMDTEFEFHVWQPLRSVTVGPFTVTPFPVNHPCPEPYALRVEYRGPSGTEVLTYSGDTDACDELVDAARDADLFLCEAAYQEGREDGLRGIHLTGRRAGETAVAAGARRLLLTHLPVWNSPETVETEAAGVYDGAVEVTRVNRRYDVARPTERSVDALAPAGGDD